MDEPDNDIDDYDIAEDEKEDDTTEKEEEGEAEVEDTDEQEDTQFENIQGVPKKITHCFGGP